MKESITISIGTITTSIVITVISIIISTTTTIKGIGTIIILPSNELATSSPVLELLPSASSSALVTASALSLVWAPPTSLSPHALIESPLQKETSHENPNNWINGQDPKFERDNPSSPVLASSSSLPSPSDEAALSLVYIISNGIIVRIKNYHYHQHQHQHQH